MPSLGVLLLIQANQWRLPMTQALLISNCWHIVLRLPAKHPGISNHFIV